MHDFKEALITLLPGPRSLLWPGVLFGNAWAMGPRMFYQFWNAQGLGETIVKTFIGQGRAQVGHLRPTGFTPPTGLAVAPTLKAFFIQPPRGLKPASCRAAANLTGVSSLVIQSPFCTSVGQ